MSDILRMSCARCGDPLQGESWELATRDWSRSYCSEACLRETVDLLAAAEVVAEAERYLAEEAAARRREECSREMLTKLLSVPAPETNRRDEHDSSE
jgi:hypothetical protein